MSGVMTNLMGYKSSALTKKDEIIGGEKTGLLSKYSSVVPGTKATVSSSIAKVAALYGAATQDMAESSIVTHFEGTIFNQKCSVVVSKESGMTFAEIQTGVNEYDLCIYTPSSGSIKACTLDRDRGVTKKFEIGFGKRNGTCILLAMFPTILQDGEASVTFEQILTLHHSFIKDGIVDEDLLELLGKLSDNVYFRIKNGVLKMRGFDPGAAEYKPTNIQKTALDSGAYTAKGGDTVYGTPQIFVVDTSAEKATTSSTTIKKLSKSFAFDRELKPYEEKLIPILKEELVVPSYVLRTLKLIKGFPGEERHARNVLYYGEAGSGKSLSSQMLAYGLKLPYVVFSCSPNTSELDLIGQIIPKVGGASEKTMTLLKQLHSLPTMEDLHFDLKGAYKRVSGGKEMPEGMKEFEVSTLIEKRRTALIKQIASAGSDGNDFEFVPSPIIQALVNGWCVEIQEIANIKDAGALTVLNQLLEISTGGSHRLVTGETITRHPDAVIVCTTNVEYAGCRAINQSVLDRMNYTKEIETPSTAQLVDIVAINTKCSNKPFIKQCVQVMNNIREYLSDAGIDDGVVGVRSVIDWVDNVMKLGDIKEGAKETIISKATFDTDVQKYLYAEYVDKTEFTEVLTFEEMAESTK